MASILLTMNHGYHAYGAENINDQIIITSKGRVRRSMIWISTGPLPGIY